MGSEPDKDQQKANELIASMTLKELISIKVNQLNRDAKTHKMKVTGISVYFESDQFTGNFMVNGVEVEYTSI